MNDPKAKELTNRAKAVLSQLGIVDMDGAGAVRSVLNAAAWTYVAATLESVLTLLYYDQRVRKEGYDLEVLASELPARR